MIRIPAVHIAFLTAWLILSQFFSVGKVQLGTAAPVQYLIPAYKDDTINPDLMALDIVSKLIAKLHDKKRVKRSTTNCSELLRCPSNVCGSCRCDVIDIHKESSRYWLHIKCCSDTFMKSDEAKPQAVPVSLPRTATTERIRNTLTDKVSTMISTHDTWHQEHEKK